MKKKLFAMAFIAAMVGQVNATDFDPNAMLDKNGNFNTSSIEGMVMHRDEVNSNRIEANKNAIAANKDAIASNKEELDAVRDVVNAEQHQRVENTANIAQNTATNIKQDHAIAANKDAIASNKEAIQDAQQAASGAFDTAMKAEMNNHRQDQILDKHGSDIASNTEAIRAHYAEMKNNFAAVNTRLDNLDDEMKKGFAANAAIAGLFQPYSVGKFNVTAALGGYDSEQAIAIGSGYRFNENFAMKAGVATNTSDFDAVTYNVGVNFEW